MGISCHIYKISRDKINIVIEALDRTAKNDEGIRIRVPGYNEEFKIRVIQSPRLETSQISYYTLIYPEPVEYIPYGKDKTVTDYKREITNIVIRHLNKDYGLIFLCGGNIQRARGILTEIVEAQLHQEIIMAPFTVPADKIGFLVREHGFGLKYTKLYDPRDLSGIDALAIWGSELEDKEFYKWLRDISENPDKEIKLIDKNRQRLGTIGITRQHDKTKAFVVRIWKNLRVDNFVDYAINRIIAPMIEDSNERKSTRKE